MTRTAGPADTRSRKSSLSRVTTGRLLSAWTRPEAGVGPLVIADQAVRLCAAQRPPATLIGEGLMKAEVAMGGMMGGTMGAWIVLWIFLGLALAIGGGIVAARVLSTRRGTDQRQVQATESAAVQEAKDTLRRRYANGEISREDYLQGKVELED